MHSIPYCARAVKGFDDFGDKILQCGKNRFKKKKFRAMPRDLFHAVIPFGNSTGDSDQRHKPFFLRPPAMCGAERVCIGCFCRVDGDIAARNG